MTCGHGDKLIVVQLLIYGFKGAVPQIVSWLGLDIIWKTIRN